MSYLQSRSLIVKIHVIFIIPKESPTALKVLIIISNVTLIDMNTRCAINLRLWEERENDKSNNCIYLYSKVDRVTLFLDEECFSFQALNIVLCIRNTRIAGIFKIFKIYAGAMKGAGISASLFMGRARNSGAYKNKPFKLSWQYPSLNSHGLVCRFFRSIAPRRARRVRGDDVNRPRAGDRSLGARSPGAAAGINSVAEMLNERANE